MEKWQQLGECRANLAGLARALDRANSSTEETAAEAPKARRTAGLQEKKRLYADLVKKIMSGEASSSDTIEAERLGEELGTIEDEEAGTVEDAVQVPSRAPLSLTRELTKSCLMTPTARVLILGNWFATDGTGVTAPP